MSKNPYEILGVSTSATREEIDQAYYTLRDKCRLDMHSEGEKGKLAAKRLNEVENAYREIIIDYTGDAPSTQASSYNNESTNRDTTYNEPVIDKDPIIEESAFSAVEKLIREKKYPEAQRALDNIFERNAEWHFYQSAIYYKQGWLNESKSQLQIACNMDPNNVKYKESLEKLDNKLSASKSAHATSGGSVNVGGHNGYHRSYGSDYDARSTEDGCCRACQAAICVNCLCDCCCRG